MSFTLYYILKVIKKNFKYIGHANTKSFYIKDMTIHVLWYPQWLLRPLKLRRDRRIDTFPWSRKESFFLFTYIFLFLVWFFVLLFWFVLFETRDYSLALEGLKLLAMPLPLPQPHKSWDDRWGAIKPSCVPVVKEVSGNSVFNSPGKMHKWPPYKHGKWLTAEAHRRNLSMSSSPLDTHLLTPPSLFRFKLSP